MSAQRLSDKSRRRIERSTGLSIVRAWSHGGWGHRIAFVTDDHRHGTWHKSTGEVQWDTRVLHYTSCHEMFPEVSDSDTAASSQGD